MSSGWLEPLLYTGSATLTQLHTEINSTHYTLVYHCKNCMVFDQSGVTPFQISSSAGTFPQGWAQSQTNVFNPSTPDSGLAEHDNGMGVFQIPVASATHTSYSSWAGLTATHTNTATATATATSVPEVSAVPVPPGTTYDYVVIGGGAGGIPVADKLSEAGYSVLLIEKGPPTSGRWGGGKCRFLRCESC